VIPSSSSLALIFRTGNPALHNCTTLALVSAFMCPILSCSCYSYTCIYLPVPALALFAFFLLSRCYSSPPTGVLQFRSLQSLTTISALFHSRSLSALAYFLKVTLKRSHVFCSRVLEYSIG